MVSKRKPAIAVVALAIAGLALSACSTGGASAPTGSATASGAPSLPGTGWVTADAASVKQGGTLTLPVDDTPLNWNVNQLDSGTVDDAQLAQLFVPSFIEVAEDGSYKANPDYATSLELTGTAPQTVELKINPAAKWSDGTDITVDDVAANWAALNGTNDKYNPISTNVWKDIASVKAGTDNKDAIITFATPNADWASVFSTIYPKWLMATPDSFEKAWAKGPFAPDGKTYVSGGPFILSKFDGTSEVATFVPNTAWWGAKPKLDTIVFKAVSRDGLAQAFSNGEIDAMDLHGSADNYATVKGVSTATIERSLGTTYRHVTLNGTSTVFKDEKVRQAFAASLDRTVLAQAILSGVESPVTLLDNLIYLPGQNGYEAHTADVFGGGLDFSKKTLTDDGYTFGSDGIATKDGAALTVRFVIPSENKNSANIAALVTKQAGLAGFKVNTDVVPSADFFAKYITTKTRDFDATYFAWQGTSFPIASTESIFYPADSGQNYPGVTDDSLGADWTAANAELDPTKRIALANGIDKKLTALATTIPLFPEPFAYGVKSGLVNYGPSQFEIPNWAIVGFKS